MEDVNGARGLLITYFALGRMTTCYALVSVWKHDGYLLSECVRMLKVLNRVLIMLSGRECLIGGYCHEAIFIVEFAVQLCRFAKILSRVIVSLGVYIVWLSL